MLGNQRGFLLVQGRFKDGLGPAGGRLGVRLADGCCPAGGRVRVLTSPAGGRLVGYLRIWAALLDAGKPLYHLHAKAIFYRRAVHAFARASLLDQTVRYKFINGLDDR